MTVVYGWKAVRAGPAVWREKREGMREESERKKREQAEKKKKELEERIRKATEDAAANKEENGGEDVGLGEAPKEGEEVPAAAAATA